MTNFKDEWYIALVEARQPPVESEVYFRIGLYAPTTILVNSGFL